MALGRTWKSACSKVKVAKKFLMRLNCVLSES